MNTEEWSKKAAELAVWELVDASYIAKDDADAAVAIVAEEIWVILCMGDYPPPNDFGQDA